VVSVYQFKGFFKGYGAKMNTSVALKKPNFQNMDQEQIMLILPNNITDTRNIRSPLTVVKKLPA